MRDGVLSCVVKIVFDEIVVSTGFIEGFGVRSQT